MKKVFLIITVVSAVISVSFYNETPLVNAGKKIVESNESIAANSIESREKKFYNHAQSIFSCIDDSTLSFEAFHFALKGYHSLKNRGKLNEKEQLIVVDFNMSSALERFFLIDLENEQVVYKKLVAHGKNSGEVFPDEFSNIKESRQSSLGFYVTGNTYDGKYDNSLLIHGQEWTNSRAQERGVVIHAADYATKEFLKKNGRLGRSFGCPALPHEDYEEIIDQIKDGTAMFIYYKDKKYLSRSKFLKRRSYLAEFY